jgi:hypothetical protein
MAALAPVTGLASGTGPALAPQRPSPLPALAPDPKPAGSSFTAFPPSYGAFGNSDAGFGTIGVKNGSLTVVPAAADPAKTADPPPGTPAPGDAANRNDPPGDPPPPAPPVATLPPQPLPKVYGLQAPELGLGQPQEDFPGPFAAANQQKSIAPDPQEHAQQLRDAAIAAEEQAKAQAAETQRAQLTSTLQNVTFHLAAANSAGDTAAAAEFSRTAVKINGALNNQIWAGIGTTPPPAFAKPEIPNVFLNLPA